MAVLSPNINVMTAAARKAASRLRRDFGEIEHLQVSVKGPADFVSTADIRTEKILREELHKARPDFGFLLEEAGEEIGKDPTQRWIIDPLDGTTNFLHSLEQFSISIALERNGKIIAGVVYEPLHDNMFWAETGAGAYLNDRRLRVSARNRMSDSLIAAGIPFKGNGDHENFIRQMAAVMAESAGIRRFGVASLDLAYLAAGRFEGYWDTGIHLWDVAAGIILVREAGGYVSGLDGKDYDPQSGQILAANDQLHAELVKLLKT